MTADPKQMKSLTLAYIGDAVYELYIRQFLVESGEIKPHELHKKAINYVSAVAQATIIRHWLRNNQLTSEEENIVKRGRNAKSGSIPKNTDVQTYRYSTGFEALIGYHFLSKNNDRLQELLFQATEQMMAKNE